MKCLIVICTLFASCSIFKKSVNTQRNDVSKSTIQFKDSSGSLVVEEVKKIDLTQWGAITVDSGYDKVTEEVVTEVIDSNTIRREIKRTIKEKGQKRTEQLSHTSTFDSASSMITGHSQLQELEKEDSAAVIVTTQKIVKRTSFLPWWIWLIVAGLIVLGWWQRNPIIKFLTPNKKAR